MACVPLCTALLFTAPANAQVMAPSMSPFAYAEGVEESVPDNASAFGQSELAAKSMLAAMRLEQRQRDLCWALGCLVIVNESKSYMVTGFYVQTSNRDGAPTWSRNQFGAPLLAMRATYRFKSGGADACDRAAFFELRKPHSKEKLRYDTHLSLCSSPQHDSLVRIKAVIPEVEVGDPVQ